MSDEVQLVVGVAIQRDGRILAARRHPGRSRAGGWEFPGGKVESRETPEQAAVREIAEELACIVRVTGWLEPRVVIRPGLELLVATAELTDGEPIPQPGDHDAIRWVRPDQLGELTWLDADEPFVTALTANWRGVPH